MTEATKTQDEIHVDDLDVDQERRRETEDLDMKEKTQHYAEKGQTAPGSFSETAELREYYIFDINDMKYSLRPQPAGVFAAISKEANKFIEEIMKSFDKSQIAAMEIFEKGAEAFGAEGDVAAKLEQEAVQTITKKTIPLIIEILAKDAPEFMAKVVSLILETDPMKTKNNLEPTYSVDEILWKFSVDEQVAAIGFYIDSLNLGVLKKKVTSFREA